MTRRDLVRVVLFLAAAVVFLVITRSICYMPVSVPHHVLAAAYEHVPSGFTAVDEIESGSPAHYRLEVYVTRGSPTDEATHVL